MQIFAIWGGRVVHTALARPRARAPPRRAGRRSGGGAGAGEMRQVVKRDRTPRPRGNTDSPASRQKERNMTKEAILYLVKTDTGKFLLQGTGDPSQNADFSLFDLDG